jgi:hypothetical protein
VKFWRSCVPESGHFLERRLEWAHLGFSYQTGIHKSANGAAQCRVNRHFSDYQERKAEKKSPVDRVVAVLNCLGKASCRAAVTNRRLSPEKSGFRKLARSEIPFARSPASD